MPEPEETFEQAQALWERHAEEIRCDDRAALALDRLAAAVATLRTRMRAARMDRICRLCGEHDAGGCCGAAVARQVDVWILLAHRLLGHPASAGRGDLTTCAFLGPEGCVLLVKPFICVKYDCRDVLASVDPHRLDDVLAAREALFDAWLAVEQRLRELCGQGTVFR